MGGLTIAVTLRSKLKRFEQELAASRLLPWRDRFDSEEKHGLEKWIENNDWKPPIDKTYRPANIQSTMWSQELAINMQTERNCMLLFFLMCRAIQ